MEQLITRDLSVGYHQTPILKRLNVSLIKGELVCLMGPNGCGKSTLLHTLSGLLKPISGEIELSSKGPREKTVAVVLTEKSFHPDLTGWEMVTMGRYPHLDWMMKLQADDLSKIEQAIEQTGIAHLKDKRNQNMSDGQRQMVMVARALAQDTPILLLDEPTSHLDLNNRVEIMNLLRSLAHDQEKSILIATHELDLALQTADRVWLADGSGKLKTGVPEDLVLDGSLDEVFQLKGFTLKTGKVDHKLQSGKSVGLTGEGYAFLWTKNAVERTGIEVRHDSEIQISIEESNGKILWKTGSTTVHSIADLVAWLRKI